MFSKVPDKLKNFATKTATAAQDLKAKLSFDTFPQEINERTINSNKDNMTNIASMLTWVIKMVKNLIEKVDQQWDIITVHTEALANPKEALDVKDEEINMLKTAIEQVSLEADETRQRGMKGNLLISSPNRGANNKTLVDYEIITNGVNTRKESHTSIVKKLIKLKTDVEVQDREIIACHPMGKQESNTFLLRLVDRSPGSSWDQIVQGMKKGGNFKHEVNVFINFQLTKRRIALASKARTAKSAGKISKVFVDHNGKIRVKKEGADEKYVEVKTEADLNNFIK